MMLMDYLKKYKWSVVGVFVGSIIGYLYWYHVGCITGTCPITTYWHNSTLYGAFLGALVGSYFPTARASKESK